jgi:hypothetical protein
MSTLCSECPSTPHLSALCLSAHIIIKFYAKKCMALMVLVGWGPVWIGTDE